MNLKGSGRRSIAVVIGLSLAALALGPSANAGKVASSKVTIRIGDLNQAPLFGRVTSKNSKCIAGRRVVIFVDAPGKGPLDFADNPTNAKGKWTFSSQLQGGTAFHAKVKAKKVGGVTCAAAVSPVKSF